MTVYRFTHPAKPDIVFEWQAELGLLSKTGHPDPIALNPNAQDGELLRRFIRHGFLTPYGSPRGESFPDIIINRILARLLEAKLKLTKEETERFVKNVHGAGYKWLVEPVEIIEETTPPDQPEHGPDPVTSEPVVRKTPESIKRKILRFKTYREEKTRDFVGRGFLFRAIDDFMAREPAGYLTIEGDPGFGKTTFLAELADRKPESLYHFNIRSETDRRHQFLENICAQIIDRCGLETIPDSLEEPSTLIHLLETASEAWCGDRKLLILVDALDEVDRSDHPMGNILGLPRTLPAGVYVVATSRRRGILPLTYGALEKHDISQDHPEHLDDIRAYIGRFLDRDGMKRHRGSMSESDYVEELTRKSEGNFMYLCYVLPAIERGMYSDDDPESLPDGLLAYYEHHWTWMRSRSSASWSTVEVPILVALTIVREPVDLATLATFARVPEQRRVAEVLSEWRELLHVVEEDHDGKKEKRYRIYHASFKDFISNKDQVKGEHVDLEAAHGVISDVMWQRYLEDRAGRE